MKLDRIGTVIMFVITLLFLVAGLDMFYVGFHNTDLGYNIKYINAEYDLDLVDIGTPNNTERTPSELYSLGLDQMINSIKLFTVCIIILLVYLIVFRE